MLRDNRTESRIVFQCAIPIFESLVPNETYSKSIVSVITVCAEWHALAKLRMHTDTTLSLLEQATINLGNEFRTFISNVCSKVPTEELTSEVEARLRRLEKQKLEREAKEAEAAKQAGKSLDAQVRTVGCGAGVAAAKAGEQKARTEAAPSDIDSILVSTICTGPHEVS